MKILLKVEVSERDGIGGLPSARVQPVLVARRIVRGSNSVNPLFTKICGDLNRQVDLELRALAGLAGYADPPAMLFDDLLHDREAQAGAAFLC